MSKQVTLMFKDDQYEWLRGSVDDGIAVAMWIRITILELVNELERHGEIRPGWRPKYLRPTLKEYAKIGL